MITLTKVYAEDLSAGLLDRLYVEAFPYISNERQRMGTEALKSALTDGLENYPIIQYDVDGYTVGIASYSEVVYNGKLYMFHRHPIYGQTESGSRSWWYSEEFQQKNSEYVRAEGYVGVITLFNSESPAGRAVGSHFGSFNKYYMTPVIADPSSIGFKLKQDAQGVLQAYVIDLMEEQMAIKANIVIDQGADYLTTFDVTDDEGNPLDLTNYTGAAQMRKHYTSSTYYTFTVAFDTINGVVSLSMSSNTTNSIPAGRYVYDCEILDGTNNKKSRLVEGIATVTPQVTR